MSDTPRPKLTARQQQVLAFIQDCIQTAGYPPTIREIGEHLQIRSTNGVNDHLKALERKGYLTRQESKSRALVPVGGESDMVEVPVYGRIAAGPGILAVEEVEDKVRVDRFFLGPHKEVFALRVQGDSMINDGIHDGDFIFVRKQPKASRGDIVVAWIEGAPGAEATVKRYFPEGDRVRFQPANDAYEPIYVSASEFRETQIVGIVVGVYRMLN